MNSKRIALGIIALATVVSLGTAANNAFARGHGNYHGQGQMMGQAYEALTPEKQAKFDSLIDAFNTKVTPLRDKLWAKHTELNALSSNPNTKPEDIRKLTDEITALRTQYRTEAANLDASMQKEVGIKTHFATMGHRGMGGMGGGCGMMGGKGGMDSGMMQMHDGEGPHRGQNM